jgi:hypothetical protein
MWIPNLTPVKLIEARRGKGYIWRYKPQMQQTDLATCIENAEQMYPMLLVIA